MYGMGLSRRYVGEKASIVKVSILLLLNLNEK